MDYSWVRNIINIYNINIIIIVNYLPVNFSGSVMACEFLVLNGAKINAVDTDGNTALHLAALYGSTGQVYKKYGRTAE